MAGDCEDGWKCKYADMLCYNCTRAESNQNMQDEFLEIDENEDEET